MHFECILCVILLYIKLQNAINIYKQYDERANDLSLYIKGNITEKEKALRANMEVSEGFVRLKAYGRTLYI